MKHGPSLLDENVVVNSVAAFLVILGFVIRQKLTTSEVGVDVHATHPGSGEVWFVEAKGQTSSKRKSLRYGKPFTGSQVDVHVARALYTPSALRQRYPDRRVVHVGLALPDDDAHQKRVASISGILGRVGIEVLWVSANGKVRLAERVAE
jgi:hypothetical protein